MFSISQHATSPATAQHSVGLKHAWTFGRPNPQGKETTPATGNATPTHCRCAAPPPTAEEAIGSHRRKLWNLAHACHCPVIGVCLPLDGLRLWVNKSKGQNTLTDDYTIHVAAVSECTQRNPLSMVLQKELDRRYQTVIRHFRAAKTPRAVAELWGQAVRQGDTAGAFWATLTHPQCDDALQEVALRDMHMLQHQAGAAARVDLGRYHQLVLDHQALCQDRIQTQARHARVLADKTAHLDRLMAEAMGLRAELMAKSTRMAYLEQDLATLQAAQPWPETNRRLQSQVEHLTQRLAELEAQNTALRLRPPVAIKPQAEPLSPEAHSEAGARPATPSIKTLRLPSTHVLCVGGRHGNVANYRHVIEKAGGQFSHHDGGLEDTPRSLEAVLGAADLVICQTGCISHNAYWRVKDFCKRTGKKCIFVENPSTSSFCKTLQHMAESSPAAEG